MRLLTHSDELIDGKGEPLDLHLRDGAGSQFIGLSRPPVFDAARPRLLGTCMRRSPCTPRGIRLCLRTIEHTCLSPVLRPACTSRYMAIITRCTWAFNSVNKADRGHCRRALS